VWPTCKCGCGQKVKWSYGKKGFVEFSQGHQSRVKNNWGHNKKAQEKSAETRRKQYECGERKVWNEGLTKESDDRVKLNAIKSSISINSNADEIHRRSEYMKYQRKVGKIKILHGPDHSQWKGGVSEINILARTNRRLYDEWKYPILVRDEFKCKDCGNVNGQLHVHHDIETMGEIVKKHTPDEYDITDFEFKKSIADKIVDYHIKNNVSGKTLCNKCHGSYHPSLNF
jgi:hypothetical protein